MEESRRRSFRRRIRYSGEDKIVTVGSICGDQGGRPLIAETNII